MQSLGYKVCLKHFLVPKNNHWLKRTLLVFAFILFDYSSTLIFCRAPHEEANLFARMFMEIFGIPLGLTLFVFVVNLPVYVILSLDSHVVRLPSRTATAIEPFVDAAFAWFIAGWHFSGGSSWFWFAPDLTRQIFGAFLYITIAFLFVKPHKPRYTN
ncbi:MAG: hypothetical protein QXI91_05060 [Candidatus Bathyarchaeia archaeon]